MIRSNTARLFAENFDARLAGIVILPDCPLFETSQGGPQIHDIDEIDNICAQQIQGRHFSESSEAPQAAATQPQRAGMCSCMWIYIYIYIRVRGYPPNGIFGPCACLLVGGSGAWRLLARRHGRHFDLKKVKTLMLDSPQGDYTRRKGLVFSTSKKSKP